jgi:pyruvate/2-oxoglutarate dehydrogenase complex dihydrolipoamide dehydrogenase (E3) component
MRRSEAVFLERGPPMARGEDPDVSEGYLVAAGCVLNTQVLGLKHVGVELDDSGYIRIGNKIGGRGSPL